MGYGSSYSSWFRETLCPLSVIATRSHLEEPERRVGRLAPLLEAARDALVDHLLRHTQRAQPREVERAQRELERACAERAGRVIATRRIKGERRLFTKPLSQTAVRDETRERCTLRPGDSAERGQSFHSWRVRSGLPHPPTPQVRESNRRAPSATREREERALAEPRERVLWRAGGATHITHERAQPCVLGQCSSHTTHTLSACGTGAF